jgi:hypothetical protein
MLSEINNAAVSNHQEEKARQPKLPRREGYMEEEVRI